MAIRYVLAGMCLVAVVLFSVLARKLWQGKGLWFISGNQFVNRKELGLPYQKRLAGECAVMLIACNLALIVLAVGILCSIDLKTLILAAAAFTAAITIGALAISGRADKAARTDQAETSLRVKGWPGNDFGEGPTAKQWIIVALLYLISLPLCGLIVSCPGS